MLISLTDNDSQAAMKCLNTVTSNFSTTATVGDSFFAIAQIHICNTCDAINIHREQTTRCTRNILHMQHTAIM